MNSNQRSDANKQSSNDGNELAKPPSRAFSVDHAGQNKTPAQGDAQSDAQTGDDSQKVAADAPSSPGGHRLAADQKMDDDSGLSNTANRKSSELDRNERQERQSNVGRRSDGTPD